MERDLTPEDALQVWSAGLREPETPWRHVATAELYDLAMKHLSGPTAETILTHLRRCPSCHSEWRALLWDLTAAELTDQVRFQAAASQGPVALMQVQTNAGLYTVIVRPSVSPGEAAIITVEVNHPEQRELLAGQTIRLTSQQGRLLLQGQVFDGEVSQSLDMPLTYAELYDAQVEPVAEFSEEMC